MKWKICENKDCKKKIKPKEETIINRKILCQRCYFLERQSKRPIPRFNHARWLEDLKKRGII